MVFGEYLEFFGVEGGIFLLLIEGYIVEIYESVFFVQIVGMRLFI